VAEEGSEIHAAHYVPAGRDRFRGQREIQFTKTLIDFKVSTLDTDGGLAVCEITSCKRVGRRGTCTTSRTSGSTLSRANT
jgi:hypothetical protein